MIPLRVTAEFRIRAGKDEAFRLIMRALESAVREHDKGTLIYDWYISPDGRTAFVHEHYESTDAFIAHAMRAASEIGRLAEVGDFLHVTFAGEPSEFIKKTMVSHEGDVPGSPKVEFYNALN
jgi:quinol monooxygenase YgiN